MVISEYLKYQSTEEKQYFTFFLVSVPIMGLAKKWNLTFFVPPHRKQLFMFNVKVLVFTVKK